jgi:hypothetical protein
MGKQRITPKITMKDFEEILESLSRPYLDQMKAQVDLDKLIKAVQQVEHDINQNQSDAVSRCQ